MGQLVGTITSEKISNSNIRSISIYKGAVNHHVTVINYGGRLRKTEIEESVLENTRDILGMLELEDANTVGISIRKIEDNRGMIGDDQEVTMTEFGLKVMEREIVRG